MQAEHYSERSIAIFGDTKPWAGNLRELGGKFNSNLRGRPGWIFQRSKEPEIATFLQQVNMGLIQPIVEYDQPVYRGYEPPQVVPRSQYTPAMSPQAAMARLSLQASTENHLTTQTPISGFSIQTPTFISSSAQPSILPTNLKFPLVYTSGDGLSYQVIIYTTQAPRVGQKVNLIIGENSLQYTVTQLNNNGSGPVDDILLTQVLPVESDTDTVPPVSRAIIMKGEWKIFCMQEDHSILFEREETIEE